ncbi:HEAT repeat domain-containing protein [Pantoea sp. CCBC3-3-1]|uniref:HEAT repeat domain-containing protein n=1 Tax=Pantoea sp. CCBC3-3-1 TaxID=2490851 RepID=UPI0011BDE0DD|nr:HEAT repeat domain-containing protein [Pantoea sp. CCBC3-3-1]
MNSEVTRCLLDACDDPHIDIKISAAYALGESGKPTTEVLRKLLDLSHNPYNEVKIVALKALGRIHRNK